MNLHVTVEGDLDLDRFVVEVECPRCGFTNPVRLKQARLRDVVICRGCKANVQLDDGMNSVRKARRAVGAALQELRDAVARIGKGK